MSISSNSPATAKFPSVEEFPALSTDKHSSFLIIAALWLLVFSASSQLMIIVAMLPLIGKQFGIPEAQLGVLVSAYAVMVGLFALVIGPISDRFGRRLILLIGAGLMTTALALHAVAFDFVSLLVVRLLAGAAGGTLSGAAVSYIGDYFPNERRGWANGWVMSSIAVGQIAGVPLGTILADNFGFRTPFLAFAVTMCVTFLMVYKFVPQPDVQMSAEKLSISGALVNYWRLLKRGEVRAAAGAFLLMFLSIAFFVIYLPTWLIVTRGATSQQIATLFLVGGVASVVTAPSIGKLSDRIGRKIIILTACVGLAVVMCSFTFVAQNMWLANGLFFVTMILVAARMTPFQALLSSIVTGEQRGILMSLTVSLGQIGFALGALLAGIVYGNFGYFVNTIIGAVFVLAMAFIVWRFVPETIGKETIIHETFS